MSYHIKVNVKNETGATRNGLQLTYGANQAQQFTNKTASPWPSPYPTGPTGSYSYLKCGASSDTYRNVSNNGTASVEFNYPGSNCPTCFDISWMQNGVVEEEATVTSYECTLI